MLVWGGDGDTELIVIWLIVENEKKLFQIRTIIGSCHIINTAWKVFNVRRNSGLHFPAFGLNTERIQLWLRGKTREKIGLFTSGGQLNTLKQKKICKLIYFE